MVAIQNRFLRMSEGPISEIPKNNNDMLDYMEVLEEVSGDSPALVRADYMIGKVWTAVGWLQVASSSKLNLADEFVDAALFISAIGDLWTGSKVEEMRAELERLRTTYAVTLEEGRIEKAHVIVQELIRDIPESEWM